MAEWSKMQADTVRVGNVVNFGGDVHKIISKTIIRGVAHFETDKGQIKMYKHAILEVFR